MMQPVLIGIAGGSGSGKTHLARTIRDTAPESVALLSMDQYFRTEVTGDPANVNFDHPAHLDLDLLIVHLRTLREGKPVLAPTYDFRSMRQRTDAVEIRPHPIVIVEGLFILAEPFSEQFDITIFLDVSDDQRLLGRILRDLQERNADIDQIVDRYQRFVRPSYHVFVAPTRHNADLVVDFTYRRALLTLLLTHVIKDCVAGTLDIAAFGREARRESYVVGYRSTETMMPVAVDIRELARAYPESAYPPSVPPAPEESPRLFLREPDQEVPKAFAGENA